VAYLVIVCTVFGFTGQFIAQEYVSAERTAIFSALNPLVAMIVGLVLLHENPGVGGIIGAALILSAIILAQRGGSSEPTSQESA